AGELLELDDIWTRPGHRVLEHVHPCLEERWEVISGSPRFRIASVEHTAQPGDVVVAPPGVPHLAWNAGETAVHVRIQIRPAMRWEQFIQRLFKLAQDAHANNLDSPDSIAMIDLLREFPEEIALP
ncbi:MAG TPA: cupin domain-containing protein, partial [Solirubrobacteraceae bacterium]